MKKKSLNYEEMMSRMRFAIWWQDRTNTPITTREGERFWNAFKQGRLCKLKTENTEQKVNE